MNNFLTWGKYVIASVGTGLSYFLGVWDTPLRVLVCFMVLDYMTGLLKAFVNKTVSSDIGLRGIARKSVILVVLITGVLLDRLINNDNWTFRTMICYFYMANEGISLLENCSALGLPIPEKIKNALIQLKGHEVKEEEEV